MKKIAVLIVDDNFVARRGLRSFLQMYDEIEVFGEASSGMAALEFISKKPVDIILMDIRMPDMDGLTATAKILKIRPEIKVIMLTVIENEAAILRALMAGARGYLVYGRFTPEEMIAAIHNIASGDNLAVPPLNQHILEYLQTNEEAVKTVTKMADTEPLTSRETDILGLISTGKSNREIAGILSIEEKTVKNHINNIYSKLQIKSRYEAINYVLRRAF